ncbi:cytochrome C [Thermodesulfobacteriota bacterium B35]
MKKFVFAAALSLAIGLLAPWGAVGAAEQAPDPQLQVSDCVKCHPKVVHQNQKDGTKHKTEVTCLDCHDAGHPPSTPVDQMIPKCSKCHEGEPHFEVKNCLGCHRNPHTPLKITFPENESVKPVCNTCHSEQVQEIDQNPSAHANVDCSFCHTKHGYIPSCLKCHEPHRQGQKFEDCVSCHRVHQPLNVAYGPDIPNKDCGACHGDIRKLLESGQYKHAKLQCVYCHKNTHGNIPACQDCHGVPHPEAMIKNFKGCLDCHVDPHNLTK